MQSIDLLKCGSSLFGGGLGYVIDAYTNTV